MRRRFGCALVLATLMASCSGRDGPSLCDGFDDLLVISRTPEHEGQTGPQEIALLRPDGRVGRVLTGPEIVASDPTFSPDGRAVAFVNNRGEFESAGPYGSSLAVVDIDGTNLRQLTPHPVDDQVNSSTDKSPDWSPASGRIVFSRQDQSFEGAAFHIMVMTPGTEPEDLVPVAQFVFGLGPQVSQGNPAWSTDGSAVAFSQTRTDAGDPVSSIWVVDSSGAGLRQVAVMPEVSSVESVTWARDDRTLLVSTYTPFGAQPILGVSVEDGSVREVGPDGLSLAWSDDEHLWAFTEDDAGTWPSRMEVEAGDVVGIKHLGKTPQWSATTDMDALDCRGLPG